MSPYRRRRTDRSGLEAPGRLLLGLGSVVLGIVGCAFALAATGGPNVWGAMIAFGILLFGFGGLAFTRHADTPWRPLRLSLAVAALLASCLLFALPWPPRGSDLGTALLPGSAILATVLAGALPSRAPRLAFGLIAMLAIYGLFIAVRFGRAVAVAAAAGSYSGPAVVLSFTLAAGIGTGWLAALWHGRSLLNHARQERTASAT